MDYKDIPVADLRLDGANPRHEPATDQREAIEALLEEGGDKLVRLAVDIAKNGLSPIDEFLVIRTSPRSSSYTVIEGNRRLTVLKLLANPDLAKALPRFQKRFKELAKSAKSVPFEVRCTVALTREEAKHWQELRHGGERQGVGVVPWGTEAAHRFAGQRGSQADRGLIFIESVEKAYPSNVTLLKDLATVRKNRLTTLGRLVSDPYVRERLGLTLQTGEVVSHYSAKELERTIGKMVGDLAHHLTVSSLKAKEQRRTYIDEVIRDHLPKKAQYRAEPNPLGAAGGRDGKAKAKGPTKSPEKPSDSAKPLFAGIDLINLGERVAGLVREIKQLDPTRYPNACAALTRVILELAVGEVFEINGWKRKNKLRDEVKFCLTKLDPTASNRKYQPVRAGLQDGTSVLAVATIQAFLHNPNFHPTATELRSIASNYGPFIKDLDSLV